ncbi:hypothetical protein TVAG_364160 [Trichomonas vaginalis G3]|uniref:Uncharacterized protein n=1 Tax=Trichomonas vaginalis (strain ATCC PRA-98 / G3) TaxID=412133 RepID=A2E9C9_TRIV3|nr:exportin 4,7-related family [Trichomonas vaginalis G3]EAY10693.1 hypothetical protein TVAG_364160 [Trichomonas vaginalis G3]KAI5538586.1 exportin 4,7-related family [Trichomonas vaginalis G3]|eukprot:XP_001322916.1 hypothetical protein [Trichomonas vaginalis G3]
MPNGLQSLVDFIKQAYGGTNDECIYYNPEIESIYMRTDNIPQLFQLIQQNEEDYRIIFFTYQSLYSILDLRGSLLNSQSLIDLLNLTMQQFFEHIELILENKPLLIKISEVCAFLMKLYFEIEKSIDPFLDIIKNVFDSGESGEIMSLSIMEFIPETFLQCHKYSNYYDNAQTISNFKDTYLVNLINIALEELNNEKLIPQSITIINKCFAFCKQDTSDNITNLVQFPLSLQFLFDLDYFQFFFSLFNIDKPSIQHQVLEILDAYLRPHNTCFTSNQLRYDFLHAALKQIIPVMESCVNSQLAQYCCHIVALICQLKFTIEPAVSDDNMEIINAISGFTTVLLQENIEIIEDTARIWSIVLTWDFGNVPEDGMNQISHIVFTFTHNAINCILNAINRNPENCYEFFKDAGSDYFSLIWSISKLSLKDVSEVILENLNNIQKELETNQTPATFLRLIFFMKLARSRASSVKQYKQNDPKFHVYFNDFYSKIIDLICTMTTVLENSGSNIDEIIVEVEKEICLFLSEFFPQIWPKFFEFMDKILLDQEMEKAKQAKEQESEEKNFEDLNENLQLKLSFADAVRIRVMENKSGMFGSLMNHIFVGISNLTNSNLENSSTVIIQLILLINVACNNDKLRDLMISTGFMNHITERTIEINYNIENMKILKRPRTTLYYLYANCIQSRRYLISFLGFFDERFEYIARNTPDPINVVTLYRDLTGVANGLRNPSFLEKLMMWFCNNHLEDTLSFISVYESEPLVLKAIIKLYNIFYSTTKCQNSPQVLTDTGLGIFMLQTSSKIIEQLFSLLPNFEILIIISRIFNSCLTSRTANYGVMKHYNDFSINAILSKFFLVLSNHKSFYDNTKVNSYLLKALKSVSINCPDEFTKEENLKISISFTQSPFNDSNQEMYTSAWSIIEEIIHLDLNHDTIIMLRPHFVYILNALINSNQTELFCGYPLIPYMNKHDEQFVKDCFKAIVDSYDDNFKGVIEKNLDSLIDNQNKENIAKSFHFYMQKYQCGLHAIHFFRPFFE